MNHESLISSELVSMVLQKDKGPNASLINWRTADGAKAKDNYFNSVKRLLVEYKLEGHHNETTFIAKVNPSNGAEDAFNPYRQRAMLKEVFFYQDLLPLLNDILLSIDERPLRVPKFFGASTKIGEEALFFEDLGESNFRTCDKSKPLDETHGKLMIEEISRFHVASRLLQEKYSRDLGEEFPLLEESWLCDDIELRDAFAKVFRKGLLLNINLAKKIGGYDDLLPWLKSLSHRGMETMINEIKCKGPWRTIIHADFHRTNVMFRYDDSGTATDIMMIDWQTLRMTNMAAELNYVLHSSFRHNWREILPFITETYYESFKNVYKNDMFFTKEELKQEVEKNLFGFLLCFYLIPMSVCVKSQEELFRVDEEEIEKSNTKEAEKEATKLLLEFPYLEILMKDFFKEIREKDLHRKI